MALQKDQQLNNRMEQITNLQTLNINKIINI